MLEQSTDITVADSLLETPSELPDVLSLPLRIAI